MRARTLCKLGIHCRTSKRIRKYDGGNRPELCKHCYKIVGRWL